MVNFKKIRMLLGLVAITLVSTTIACGTTEVIVEKEVIKEVPVEVIKEVEVTQIVTETVVQEVEVEVVKEVEVEVDPRVRQTVEVAQTLSAAVVIDLSYPKKACPKVCQGGM